MKISRRRRIIRRSARRGAGFTLLEFVTACAIFTIVTSAIYLMLDVGRSDTFTANQRTEVLQNMRVALETIRRDANNAGDGFWKDGAFIPNLKLNSIMFLKLPNDSKLDNVTPVMPGDDVQNITVDGATVKTDVVGFVYSELNFNMSVPTDPKDPPVPLGDIAITGVDKSTNTLTIDQTNAASVFTPTRLYVIDDGQSPIIATCTSIKDGSNVIFAANPTNDPLGINVVGSTGTFQNLDPASKAACREINWAVYYVDPTTNTLMRRSFGSKTDQLGTGVNTSGAYPGYVTMPLAFNVEDFQVQYVLDSGETLNDIATLSDWSRVRMVRVTLTVRSPDLDTKTRQPIRETMTSINYVRNLADQERAPAT